MLAFPGFDSGNSTDILLLLLLLLCRIIPGTHVVYPVTLKIVSTAMLADFALITTTTVMLSRPYCEFYFQFVSTNLCALFLSCSITPSEHSATVVTSAPDTPSVVQALREKRQVMIALNF